MSKQPKLTDWSKSNPPMIGEYNASLARHAESLRWWNGKAWSASYTAAFDENMKRRYRRMRSGTSRPMEWRGLAEKPANFVQPQPLGPL